MTLRIEIWSDIACPWCYLGKRRFARALAELQHPEDVQVTWRSFQLDPSAPVSEDRPHDELLARKFGVARDQIAPMHARLEALGAAEGVAYAFDRVRMENTFDAHRLIHHAAAVGRGDAMVERLFAAYFTNGESVGDRETLARAAADVGLDAGAARAALAGDAHAADVRADQERARSLGITGVPFFVLDERLGLSGAQTPEVIRNAIEQARQEPAIGR